MKVLSKEEINILNTFRIDDLAKNQIIDTLSRYVQQDSVLISTMSSKILLLDTTVTDLSKLVIARGKLIEEYIAQDVIDKEKLKRTRMFGIVGSTVTAIAGFIFGVFITQ